tara:strand:- start:205 stop:705 length:501 start_codon:yes stop_codon:yes gene_type:complete
MKKYILLLSLFVLFSCEDEKEEEKKEVSFWSGTYKVSAISWDCSGDENVQFIVAEETGESNLLELNVKFYDFLGDACDQGQECYDTDELSFKKNPQGNYFASRSYAMDNLVVDESILIELWGISGLEITIVESVTNQSGGFETNQWKEYWNKESQEMPSYPTCPNS